MVSDKNHPPLCARRGLVVGNYCHDVLFREDAVLAQTLGGAASFTSAVLDGLSVPYDLVAKVGPDFAYSTTRQPIVVPNSRTTLFRAHFDSEADGDGHRDRILKRVRSCDPIRPSDLPESRFDFGMAIGVGGEVLPDTLEKMVEICDQVFVDIQALIRTFDSVDGTVRLVSLKESGFYHLLPRIGFLKASMEEVLFMDIEEVRKMCCVIVTNGKHGSTVFWNDGEAQIEPFPANQVDPTGAGDSFLGGFAAGLTQGLSVPDSALLGNFFGSLTVAQIGLPKFDLRLLQRVKEEVQRRKMQCISCRERNNGEEFMKFVKVAGYEQFHASLVAVKQLSTCSVNEYHREVPTSPRAVEQGVLPQCTRQSKLHTNYVYEEPIQTVDSKP